MPIIAYKKHRFNPKTMKILDYANAIVTEYTAQGLVMSLRQLYYQFVSRGIAPNQKQFYKNLSYILVEARMTGLMDWRAIEDMTRFLRGRTHYGSPSDAVAYLVHGYGEDLWTDQKKRFEIWIEKDSLLGTIAKVCNDLDVGYFSCRGYTSATELWKASQRLLHYPQDDVTVIHMGDHDPTGIDATRDIQNKLDIFTGGQVKVIRIALTKKQIRKYKPPPFEAKIKDSRYKAYVAQHGDTCWELDSLPPDKLAGLVRETIEPHIIKKHMKAAKKKQEDNRGLLKLLTKHEDHWHRLPEIKALTEARTYHRATIRALRKENKETSRQGEVSAKRISKLQREKSTLEKNNVKLTKQLKAAKKKKSKGKKKKR